MKAQTLIAIVNRNNAGFREPITIEELKHYGVTHIAVEADGSVFSWCGKVRPMAHWAHDCGKRINAGFLTHLSAKHHGDRDCSLGGILGHIGYEPVNWHRMVFAL